MATQLLFQLHLVLGYVAWLLCFGVYVWPRLKSMDPFEAQRRIRRYVCGVAHCAQQVSVVIH
ncbi:hypothetical protein [Paraburkholderia tagetis]|uniref:Uncharacterized protein n=1 Tax=Paraburkholderia tagetis TaxID=2913261 RepID=A0A9X1UND5_9BURK|nr:hypothetical protein [Paraburkholderia tagetis]MCG5078657.1 hypothetical protein [Paraburkholderia tagetis]